MAKNSKKPSGGAVRADSSSSDPSKSDGSTTTEAEPAPRDTKSAKAPASDKPAGDDAKAAKAAADKPKKPRYAVAKGKSITSKRGILGPGDEVRVTDLSGGKERLDELAKAGVVVKA